MKKFQPERLQQILETLVEASQTDLGNADRLVALIEDDTCYVPEEKDWFWFDGRCWNKDKFGRVQQTFEWMLHLTSEAARRIEDEKLREALRKHLFNSKNATRVREAINLAKGKAGIPIGISEFDKDPWLLNVQNGTLDLRSGILRKHDPKDYLSRVVGAAYNPQARAPTFTVFLNRIFSNNQELIRYIKRVLGYSLTGLTREQIILILHGEGRNGKSTLLRVIRWLLGGYAAQADFSTFVDSKNERIRNDLARLRGARFVSAVEADKSKPLSEVLLKSISGEDLIAARFLFKEYFEFMPQFQLFLAANHKPAFTKNDFAIWRRIRLIPFLEKIPEHEQDKELVTKLQGEAEGILAWMVEGCLEWQADGLQTPDIVLEATDQYQKEQDNVAEFIEQKCERTEGATSPTLLQQSYKAWCSANGYEPVSPREFGDRLKAAGFKQVAKHSGRFWVGISLKDGGVADDPSI